MQKFSKNLVFKSYNSRPQPPSSSEDEEDEYPLHDAVFDMDPDEVRKLLRNNTVDVNQRDLEGCTPICLLVRKCIQTEDLNEILELLLDKGADPTIKDDKGNTAADYARIKATKPIGEDRIRAYQQCIKTIERRRKGNSNNANGRQQKGGREKQNQNNNNGPRIYLDSSTSTYNNNKRNNQSKGQSGVTSNSGMGVMGRMGPISQGGRNNRNSKEEEYLGGSFGLFAGENMWTSRVLPLKQSVKETKKATENRTFENHKESRMNLDPYSAGSRGRAHEDFERGGNLKIEMPARPRSSMGDRAPGARSRSTNGERIQNDQNKPRETQNTSKISNMRMQNPNAWKEKPSVKKSEAELEDTYLSMGGLFDEPEPPVPAQASNLESSEEETSDDNDSEDEVGMSGLFAEPEPELSKYRPAEIPKFKTTPATSSNSSTREKATKSQAMPLSRHQPAEILKLKTTPVKSSKTAVPDNTKQKQKHSPNKKPVQEEDPWNGMMMGYFSGREEEKSPKVTEPTKEVHKSIKNSEESEDDNPWNSMFLELDPPTPVVTKQEVKKSEAKTEADTCTSKRKLKSKGGSYPEPYVPVPTVSFHAQVEISEPIIERKNIYKNETHSVPSLTVNERAESMRVETKEETRPKQRRTRTEPKNELREEDRLALEAKKEEEQSTKAPRPPAKSRAHIRGGLMSVSLSDSRNGWFRDYEEFAQVLQGPDEDDAYERVKVAIIDSGVTPDHPHLDLVQDYRDFIEEENGSHKKMDITMHGSNGLHLLVKVAPEADYYIARCFKDGSADMETPRAIARAIKHAQQEWKVDIITLACGFEDEDEDMRIAINHASDSGILIFAAASNEGNRSGITFPARMNGRTICMFGSDGNSKIINVDFNPAAVPDWPFNFALPGKDVQAMGEKAVNGTSIATVIGAGVAAGIIDFARQPDIKHDVDARLLRTIDGMSKVFKEMSVIESGYHCVMPIKLVRCRCPDKYTHRTSKKRDHLRMRLYSALALY